MKKKSNTLTYVFIAGIVFVAVWYFFLKDKTDKTSENIDNGLIPQETGKTEPNNTDITGGGTSPNPQKTEPQKENEKKTQKYDLSEFDEVIPTGKVQLQWIGQVYNPVKKKLVGSMSGNVTTEIGTVKQIGVKVTVSPFTKLKTKSYYLHKSYITSSFGTDKSYKELNNIGITVTLIN